MAFTFVVEDGTRKSDANAYITVQEWKDHHQGRGVASVTDGAYSDTEIESGIVNATDYIDKRFGDNRFRGWRSTRNQALEWPRTDAFDDDDYTFPDVPNQLKKGTAEYALLALQLDRNLAPVPGTTFGIVDPVTGTVTTQASTQLSRSTEKVGPIEDTKAYQDGTSTNKPMVSTGSPMSQSIPEYPQADEWIKHLLRSTTSRVVLRG